MVFPSKLNLSSYRNLSLDPSDEIFHNLCVKGLDTEFRGCPVHITENKIPYWTNFLEILGGKTVTIRKLNENLNKV